MTDWIAKGDIVRLRSCKLRRAKFEDVSLCEASFASQFYYVTCSHVRGPVAICEFSGAVYDNLIDWIAKGDIVRLRSEGRFAEQSLAGRILQ